LKAKGFYRRSSGKGRSRVADRFDIKFAFNKWTFGEDFLRETLKLAPETIARTRFSDLLAAVGFSKRRDRGRQCAHLRRDDGGKGAPHLKPSTTTCSTAPIPAAKVGKRYLSVESHIRMMRVAAVHLGRDQ